MTDSAHNKPNPVAAIILDMIGDLTERESDIFWKKVRNPALRIPKPLKAKFGRVGLADDDGRILPAVSHFFQKDAKEEMRRAVAEAMKHEPH